MELLYIYIKNFGHRVNENSESNNQFIMNKEFNFSDRFNFNYSLEEQKLLIEKKAETHPDFYGQSIKNVKMIVGQNGAGKTYLLDILGMNRSDRIDESFIRKYKTSKMRDSLKFHNTSDDISYFKDEYIIVYLLKDADKLEDCIFGMEVIGNFHKGGFIKNLDVDEDTFYKLPIGFVFKYEDKRIKANGYHFFDYIDWETGVLTRNQIPGHKYINKICEECNFFYIAHSYNNNRINVDKPRFSGNREHEDDEYLMKRFYRKLKMDSFSDYKSGYVLLYDKKYEEFRGKIFKFSPEINLLHKFSQNEVLPTLKPEEKIIGNNYSTLMGYFENQLHVEKQMNEKENLILKWIDEYIIDSFTVLLKESFSKEDIKTRLDTNELKVEEDIEKINVDIKIFEKANEKLLIDIPFSNKIKDIYDEFIYMISVVKKINEYGSEINISDDIFGASIDNNLNKGISVFESCVYLKLLISRYVLSRLSLKFEVIKEGKYQSSFEEVIKKIMKLNIECFKKNNKICLGYTYKSEIELLDTLESYENIDYCDIKLQFSFGLQGLSEGEKKIFVFFSKVITSLRNSEENSLNIFLLDEPDAFLHPQWAQEFINRLFIAIDVFSKEVNKLNVQFIITTHSPFILSDVRKEDIILLEYDDTNKCNNRFLQPSLQSYESFGANIHTMLSNNFFMKSTIGDFANQKIKNTLRIIDKYKQFSMENINEEQFKKEYKQYMMIEETENVEIDEDKLKKKIKYTIDMIGEPIIKRKLEEIYSEAFIKDNQYYEEAILKLQNEKAKLNEIINSKGLDNIDGIMDLLDEKIKELKKKADGNL